MHKLLILDEVAGHVEIEFAPPEVTTKEAKETRKQAQRAFNEVLTRQGWIVLANVAPPELEGQTLKKFDARASELVAIPPQVAG